MMMLRSTLLGFVLTTAAVFTVGTEDPSKQQKQQQQPNVDPLPLLPLVDAIEYRGNSDTFDLQVLIEQSAGVQRYHLRLNWLENHTRIGVLNNGQVTRYVESTVGLTAEDDPSFPLPKTIGVICFESKTTATRVTCDLYVRNQLYRGIFASQLNSPVKRVSLSSLSASESTMNIPPNNNILPQQNQRNDQIDECVNLIDLSGSANRKSEADFLHLLNQPRFHPALLSLGNYYLSIECGMHATSDLAGAIPPQSNEHSVVPLMVDDGLFFGKWQIILPGHFRLERISDAIIIDDKAEFTVAFEDLSNTDHSVGLVDQFTTVLPRMQGFLPNELDSSTCKVSALSKTQFVQVYPVIPSSSSINSLSTTEQPQITPTPEESIIPTTTTTSDDATSIPVANSDADGNTDEVTEQHTDEQPKTSTEEGCNDKSDNDMNNNGCDPNPPTSSHLMIELDFDEGHNDDDDGTRPSMRSQIEVTLQIWDKISGQKSEAFRMITVHWDRRILDCDRRTAIEPSLSLSNPSQNSQSFRNGPRKAALICYDSSCDVMVRNVLFEEVIALDFGVLRSQPSIESVSVVVSRASVKTMTDLRSIEPLLTEYLSDLKPLSSRINNDRITRFTLQCNLNRHQLLMEDASDVTMSVQSRVTSYDLNQRNLLWWQLLMPGSVRVSHFSSLMLRNNNNQNDHRSGEVVSWQMDVEQSRLDTQSQRSWDFFTQMNRVFRSDYFTGYPQITKDHKLLPNWLRDCQVSSSPLFVASFLRSGTQQQRRSVNSRTPSRSTVPSDAHISGQAQKSDSNLESDTSNNHSDPESSESVANGSTHQKWKHRAQAWQATAIVLIVLIGITVPLLAYRVYRNRKMATHVRFFDQ